MKKIFTIGLCMIGGVLAKAQTIHIGPEAGISLNSMAIQANKVQTKTTMLPGLKAGVTADIGFNTMFSIQPGLFYTRKGYKQSGDGGDTRFATDNIELPLNFQFKFPLGTGYFFAGGGPYAAYILAGSYTRPVTEGNEPTKSIVTGNNATDDIRPLDMGLNLNTGYLLSSNLFVRANVGFGISNLQPEGTSTNSMRNFSVSFTLGYLPGLLK